MGFEVSVGFRISLETSFNIRRVLVPVVDVVVVLSSVSTFILRTSLGALRKPISVDMLHVS